MLFWFSKEIILGKLTLFLEVFFSLSTLLLPQRKEVNTKTLWTMLFKLDQQFNFVSRFYPVVNDFFFKL
jgi:hypothetical protein